MGLGSEDGYYDIYPDGKDGDPLTVYCDLALGADYYMCHDCNEFWRFSLSEWSQTNALSYSFDWHPNVGYCDGGGEWREQPDASSLEQCWQRCMTDVDDDGFMTKCVNWFHDQDDPDTYCYCMGMPLDDCSIEDAYQGTLALGETVTGDTSSGSCSMTGQSSNDHLYWVQLDEDTATSCDGNSVVLSSCGSGFDTVRSC